jgi:divalent metal cation (Fe/Co/Zn/Cd) transporter
MSTGQSDDGPNRPALLKRALLLSYLSIGWGVAAGAVSITSGLLARSLGVLGLGLNVLADVGGSIGLVWRFRVERRDPDRAHRAEARASMIVAVALAIVAVTLTVAAIDALWIGSAPEKSVPAMISAGVAAAVLLPLGVAKRRTGVRLQSHALKGDGTLSVIGAALGVIALLGLLANEFLGWWWADRVAALGIAALAGAEAARVLRRRPRVVPSPTATSHTPR